MGCCNSYLPIDIWKTASGPAMDEALPGWVPPLLAGLAVVGAFALGMRMLGEPAPQYPEIESLLRSYDHLIGVTGGGSGIVFVHFLDESGKKQTHDWFWNGRRWRCGRTADH